MALTVAALYGKCQAKVATPVPGFAPGFSSEPLHLGIFGSIEIEDSKNRDDPNQDGGAVQVGGGYSQDSRGSLGVERGWWLGLPQEA